ncbi:hypothetical protein [Mycolicibacterium sp.]|jgi:hypothetical protein|uniref:hypothetical protein n=1 Tax=Mycolicibacterium sp. TaxID=2320850 RepID=UPI0028B0429A|nr:hypothetical protein [Mycolicibacterium sp.]
MATVVFVHGIAQEQLAAEVLEKDWLPALAGGVSNFGNDALAARIWSGGAKGAIDARMAYYGKPFLDPNAQGAGDVDINTEPLTPEAEELTEELATALLEAAAQAARDPHDRTQAANELQEIGGVAGEAQGPKGIVGRPALNALTRIRWFAPFGMAVAGRFVWRALTQVSRYLTDDSIRRYAQDQVLDLIGPDTRLVIGHSLGSVVAYEALHRATEKLAPGQTVTLITLGSPLGLETIIYQRLQPQPPHVPAVVNRWDNFAAQDDLVAARLDIAPMFPPSDGSTVVPTFHKVDTGSKPHDITHYLTKPSVGEVVSETLTGL